MARKVNPFAVCKAAGKRGRWPKKKVERCIRAVKKSVGMGHITDVENAKVKQALWVVERSTCRVAAGPRREGCEAALRRVKEELGYEGFKLSGR